MVRVSEPKNLRLEIETPEGASAAPVELREGDGRVVTSLSGSPSVTLSLSFVADSEAEPSSIVIDELGIFEKNTGLLSDVRPIFSTIPPLRYHATLIPRAIAGLCLFTVIAAVFLPMNLLKKFNPIVLGLVCLSLCLLDLAILYSPYSAVDLRATYAGGALQQPAGNNLNGGLWQGYRFLLGEGLTWADGVVSWARMPGYGLFCAVAGALFGHRTLLDVAMSTILLQVVFYSGALTMFAWAAGGLFHPAAVWGLGLAIAWLPKQLGLTEVDSVIAPVSLLVLAALCHRLKLSRDGRRIPLALDVAVHGTFALWFVMRPDVLPGWLVVSVVLHWRTWRRLSIPVALLLVIGVTWGAYKARYTGEFAFTTSSAGASLFCGLFEVPSRFRYALSCTDNDYFDWIRQNTPYHPQTEAANNFATREVMRFWLTYPGHFVVMVYHKMMQALDGDLWPGYPTQLQVFVFGSVPRYRIVLPMLTIVALCVVVGHQRERTLLLAWPLFLDAPLFWIMFASLGRFYSAAGIGLLAAAVPPLFERSFYDRLAVRPWRTVSVLTCAGLFAVTAWPFHDWLLRNDAFHYWTPFLDPSSSTLSVFK